jgi:putative two-component system response regulator
MITGRFKIILVDDNMTNLTMGKNLLRTFYEVFPVASAAKLFELLEHVVPNLILLDIEMPEMDGYEAIRILKADAKLADIPVIFLTAKSDEDSELDGLNLGAVDYVRKPFSGPLLLKRIETHILLAQQKKELSEQREELQKFNENLRELVLAKTVQVMQLQAAVMGTISDLVEFRDEKTGGHIARTQRYLEILVQKLFEKGVYLAEMGNWNLEYLFLSAQLHDVGKIAIPDAILNKPGKLTEEEFAIMKRHAEIGVEAIERIEKSAKEHDFLRHAKVIAGTHHEKWDGTGYPLGLRGANIPLEGRLMAIADVYDALISRRSYKEPMTAEKAERIIFEGSGTHFDPRLVEVFRDAALEFAEIAKHAGFLPASESV